MNLEKSNIYNEKNPFSEDLKNHTPMMAQYEAPRPRPPFNTQARQAAGFTEAEIAWLEQH